MALQGYAPEVTRGHVNSLSGVQNDPRFFQINAQVQPGNSGGALIDMAGNVIGVVVGELDQFASLAVTGTLPQDVNCAVKSSYLLPLVETVPALAAAVKQVRPSPAETPEKAIAALEAATWLVLVY
ncbi:MAG: trypsin-like peptidase domain-containing protein [Kiritimatiellae bacterium]|nr:trypsin-like peptidase domain-containing protein [Kiritimatiellia bacterium]